MPVEVKWLQPDHVLLAEYSGAVTPENIRYQYTVGKEMSEACATPIVHMIATVTDVTSFPTSLGALKGSFGDKARNAGWVVIVGDNRLMRFVSTLVTHVMDVRFTYVSTLADAVQFLQERDAAVKIELQTGE